MPIESATRMPWHVVMHSVRTAVAPMVSLVVARLFGLVEAYWTPITTLVITRRRCERRCLFPGIDSSEPPWERWLAQLWEAKSEQRQLCLCSDPRTACALVGSDRTAYPFGGVPLAIVLLVPRTNSAWHIAFHRFPKSRSELALRSF